MEPSQFRGKLDLKSQDKMIRLSGAQGTPTGLLVKEALRSIYRLQVLDHTASFQRSTREGIKKTPRMLPEVNNL